MRRNTKWNKTRNTIALHSLRETPHCETFPSLPQAHVDLPPVHVLNEALFSSYQSMNNVQYSRTFVEKKKSLIQVILLQMKCILV